MKANLAALTVNCDLRLYSLHGIPPIILVHFFLLTNMQKKKRIPKLKLQNSIPVKYIYLVRPLFSAPNPRSLGLKPWTAVPGTLVVFSIRAIMLQDLNRHRDLLLIARIA